MTPEEIKSTWDLTSLQKQLKSVFEKNSENELLKILKNNSFLFYDLFSRKFGTQPIFHEISFGGGYRCDFAWLNDNSNGPEWVLVEIEKPRLKTFKKNGEPSHFLSHAIEQVKSWNRYFNENPNEKKRIFGAVARFRLILVAGDKDNWEQERAAKWRIDHNNETKIEIRSSETFIRSFNILETHPEMLWSFAENPKTLNPAGLENFWTNYGYMDRWRKTIH